ncbi:MAG: signal peptidase II [Gammaproteobacteria bacterium]|nr:signal peptidase II [Gammaproteobacteria bacterium]
MPVTLRHALPWWLLAGAIAVLDQLTKLLADAQLELHHALPVTPFFNLTLMYNEGAAFSLLADEQGWQRWFFIVLSSAVSIALAIWLNRLKRNERWLAAGLSLVLGGAIGNLIDRVVHGHVIDFIQVYYQQWYWPTFNIADSAISVGAAILITSSLFARQGD